MLSHIQPYQRPQNAKNALEAYIYALRNRLYEGLAPFLKDADRDALAGRLSALEDWLYDEGEDETKSVYVAKLQVCAHAHACARMLPRV